MIKLARKTIIPCSKCGDPETPKYRRKKLRKNGKRTISRATYCILCHYDDQKTREARRYDKKLAYNRKWRKANKEKVNAYKRKSYAKKRPYITPAMLDPGRVDWYQTKNSSGFSQMTYTPSIFHGFKRKE